MSIFETANMVREMVFRVEGACRGNGRPDAIGAAACCLYTNSSGTGEYRKRTAKLPPWPTPTNQRAELIAIILALEWARERNENRRRSAMMNVTIHSDSEYAVKCITQWIYRWQANGWRNANGVPVKNQDLIERVSGLSDNLRNHGVIHYIWVPRDENHDADRCCNRALNEQDTSSSDSSDCSDSSIESLDRDWE